MTDAELDALDRLCQQAEGKVTIGEPDYLPSAGGHHILLSDAEYRLYMAARTALPQLVAEVRRLQKMVGFSKMREHRKGCPGIYAWDIPGACSCDEPEVVRCKMCGSRQRKDTPLEVTE